MGKELVRDELWLVSSITKWISFAIVTGLFVGSAAAGFLYILDTSVHFISSLGFWHYLLIFPGLLLSYFLVHFFTNGEKVDVEEAIHENAGAVSLTAIPIRLVSTVITIAAGGSAGKEGPCAQIGAGLMYAVSRILKLDDYDMKRLVICGTASGISAVFGTPITGAIFGVEILYAGPMFYDALIPALIGGIVSSMTAAYWGAGHLPAFMIGIPDLAPHMVMLSIAAGVFFGIVSMLHIECLHTVRKIFKTLAAPDWCKPIIGGALLLLLSLIFGTHYLGLGDEMIVAAVSGEHVPIFAFILKSLAMSITFGCGGNGGVLTPTLFVGAASGAFLANLLGLDQSVFSALGLVAVLAGSTNTPIASTVLAMELFGSAVAPFAGIACAVSYVITGHRSLYPGQLMLRPKARTFVSRKNAEGGSEIVSRFDGVSIGRLINFHIKEAKKRIIDRRKLKIGGK